MRLLRALHRLSWLTMLGLSLYMCVYGLPRRSGLVFTVALYYVLVYWVGVGIARLCGSRRPSTPVTLAPEPVRIRRVVLEDITPYDERTGDAG